MWYKIRRFIASLTPFHCTNRTPDKKKDLVECCECQYCECLTLNIRNYCLAATIFRDSE